ncbi:MAG: methyltransferase [Clostridia bacterium]|nr:methyltransferase [Clostridia bacterium]
MELKDNERLDYVNDSLSLIQNTEGLTFGTDALLLAGYIRSGYGTATELGGGTGIISMLLASRGKAKRISCVEIQEEYAELIGRNISHNGLDDKVGCVLSDIREYTAAECDLVFTNPPYMRADTGRQNKISKKNIARHEIHGGLSDFLGAAKRLLRWGGDFYAVYRTDRLTDMISEMRLSGIEPKRLTTVHADTISPPSMFLIEGRRGGGVGLRVTMPLFIYSDPSHKEYSEDMKYILEHGEFKEDFAVK